MDEKSVEVPLEGVKNGRKKFKINKNLVMLKFTLFFLYGATSSLMPYLTIHMQSIGLSMEDISLMYLTLPLTTFLAPALTGFLVDKFGKYKPVVIISFIASAGIHHLLLLIPHQETPGVVPPGYLLRHAQSNMDEIWWSPCPSRACPAEHRKTFVLDNCVDHCILGKNNSKTLSKTFKKLGGGPISFLINMHDDLGDPVEALGISIESSEDDDSLNFIQHFNNTFLINAKVNVTQLEEDDVRCGGVVVHANYSSKHQKMWSNGCVVKKCRFKQGGPDLCPPEYKESDDKTFWIYFVIRFTGSIMMTAGVTIMDPIALTMIEKYGGDFGKEKLFSSVGMAIFSPIAGALIDMKSFKMGHTDFSPAFYVYDILLMIAGFTVYLMPLETKLPADDIFRDLIKIFKMVNVMVFVLFMYCLGNVWGFIENFLFFYLKDLGAQNYLLGITVTVGTLSSTPFLYGADKLTEKIGHVNIIVIAFFAHSLRLLGYSFIESPWWCFPFEAMESVSVHLMWVAAATYCAILGPKKLLATLIGVIGMAHFSIGRGSGSFVGGQLIPQVGIRSALRIMSFLAAIAGTIYGILHYVWLRKIKLNTMILSEDLTNSKYIDNIRPKMVDQSTMVSFERLSIMNEYNAIGSLTSLGQYMNRADLEYIKRNRMRRGSYSYGMFRITRGSASKVDLPKSAVEVNRSRSSIKNSNGFLNVYTNSENMQAMEGKPVSSPKLPLKSSSFGQDKTLDKLIPEESEELIYNKKIHEEN